MPPEIPDPTRPQEWLRRARSNLHRAKILGNDPEVALEDLCFDAQQAAEKSLKGLLVHLAVPFPKTHSIADLITLVVQAGTAVPAGVLEAGLLTQYAVDTRYPGLGEPITKERYLKAVQLSEEVVAWVEQLVRSGGAEPDLSESGNQNHG